MKWRQMALKQLAKILLLAAALIAMSACGSGGASQSAGAAPSLTAGNWLFIENSTAYPGSAQAYFRGPLQTSGNSISASLSYSANINYNSGNDCWPASTVVAFSGTTSGGTADLTSAATDGQVMTITGTVNPGGSFDGTYTKPGGPSGVNTCSDDNGTIYGTAVPPLDGNWSGTLSPLGNGNTYGVTASVSQAASAQQGIYPLSGSLAFANNSCFTSGTIDSTQSYVTGERVVIVANSATSSVVLNGSLVNPTLATVIQVTQYTINGCSGAGTVGSGTLTKS